MEKVYDQADAKMPGVCAGEAKRPYSEAEQASKAAFAEAEQKSREAYQRQHEKEYAQRAAQPIMDRLTNDIVNLGEQLERSHRARNILERHPEFAEFIELLGLIRVPLRVTPVQSGRALVTE